MSEQEGERLFNFDCVKIAADKQIGRHKQASWELSYILKGRGVRSIGDREEPFREGEVVLVLPETSHCWKFNEVPDFIENMTLTFSDKLLDLVACFSPEWGEAMKKMKSLSSCIRFKEPAGCVLREIFREMNQESEAEKFVSLLRMLLVIAKSNDTEVIGRELKENQAEKRLKQIEIYVKCNYKRKITVSDISSYFGMNRSAFCVFYKKAAGETFVTMLNRYRVKMACYLLLQPEMNIAEVALKAGFSDIPHFNRTFKKIEGCTPGFYKKRGQSE